jgi:hypothetical protein
MKRLMTLVLVTLLSVGVAAVSFAQEPAAGGQAGSAETQKPAQAKKKHTKKHHKGKKGGKKAKATPAAEVK